MRLLEVYFWVALYWALYLPVSLFLYFITEQGDLLGILLIGVIFTLILTVYLARQDDWLFEKWEPAIVIYAQEPVKQRKNLPKSIPVPQTEPVEVKPYVKKEEKPRTDPTPSARPTVGSVGSSMRTDVDLSQLNADDDDLLS